MNTFIFICVVSILIAAGLRVYFYFKWKRFFESHAAEIVEILNRGRNITLDRAKAIFYEDWLNKEEERKMYQGRIDFLKKHGEKKC